MFFVDVRHNGLSKFRRISGADKYVVEQRAQAQRAIWDEQWKRKCQIEQANQQRDRYLSIRDGKKFAASKTTEEAQNKITALGWILRLGLAGPKTFDWQALYDKRPFAEEAPHMRAIPSGPIQPTMSVVPPVKSSLLVLLFPFIRRQQEEAHQAAEVAAKEKFEKALEEWREAAREAGRCIDEMRTQHRLQVLAWDERKAAFEKEKADNNEKIDAFRKQYLAKNRGAVLEYLDSIMARSEYPDFFPKQWSIDFIEESGVLIIDYELPSLDSFPTLKSVKYVQSRDLLEESSLRESELSRIYDSAVYQTCLRSLHEIFCTDESGAIKSATFNGWVNFVDKSNGKPARSCILSVQTTKEIFQQINLNAVDPKTCFRSLKGVGSAKLSGMAAVVPILRLNKTDERFVATHDVIESVSEATNIAAIPWEEFEYLVRDIFEKEFSSHGGEVKITRASRDHGVDAIAFDPDPIRGGKIVIQAKRYTNLVGVAAVRDLYGTLINEGANKGILVTTSQYGPDSYEFAKNKPITLLDGGNLLSLLDKHGHKARIDLVEAKRLGADRELR